MTSRVRCSCGRIYDPQKHTTCPDCGAESAVESVVVAEKIKPPVPPGIEPEPKRDGERKESSFAQLLKALPWPIYAGVALVTLVVLAFALRPRLAVTVAETGKREAPAPVPVHEESSPNPSATMVPFVPSGGYTIPPVIVTGSVNLGDLIANAKAGGTVTVPAGLYPGGLVIDRPMNIVADPRAGGQVVIQSEGKECLSVRSKGVTIQNVQFWCKGIGDLAAVSVMDGAELEMEGCKIQSGSGLGLLVSGNASIKTVGSTFTTPGGIAALVNKQAHASFAQSTFSDSQIGLGVGSGARAELHSCAFERLGIGDKEGAGAIMAVVGQNTQVTGIDCYFTNDAVGIGVREKASLSLTTCTFKSNVLGNRSSGLVVLRDAQVAIRKTTFVDASPYAVNVMSNGALTLEDTDISGARGAALMVGERNAPPARVEIKRSHFYHNAVGIAVTAGSSAEIEDSECRENNEGILVLEQGTRVQLKKTALVSNRDHGLQVYANAEARITDSDVRNNARGAQSGVPHKASQRASLTLEDCRVGDNQIFGVGACAQSQLILTRCVFDQESKKNIYREHDAIVQSDGGSEFASKSQDTAEASPSPESTAKPKSASKRASRKHQDRDAPQEQISRIIKRWVPHP
jgi:nitrous oxidase accessory protein NosD